MKTISREALFKDAWTRPLSRIAAEFGVRDTALCKMCDRHDIPTPGRGYWAQVASGQSFPRPQLRPVRARRDRPPFGPLIREMEPRNRPPQSGLRPSLCAYSGG
jgi:hypothetical protein